MSVEKRDFVPAPASSAGSILGSDTESPRRGSSGKFNIKINTNLAPTRHHIGNSGEPGVMDSPRPESRMRIRRRSSKGSVQSSLHKEELSDLCPALDDHEKKNDSIRSNKEVPKMVPRRDAYITPASPPYSMYGLSPASNKDPYEDVFDSLNRRHLMPGNRMRLDTSMLSPYNVSIPDTPQSMFSFQSPTSTNTFYSPMSPRGPISSPADGMTAWRRASLIPTVPELEQDDFDCEQQDEEERVGRSRRRDSLQRPHAEAQALQQKRSQSVPRMGVTNSGDTTFDMSSLRHTMESSVNNDAHGVGSGSVPYHVELARQVDAAVDKVCNDLPNAQLPQRQASKAGQPRIHPIDTSVGGKGSSASYLNHLGEPPTTGSPINGYRRGSRGLIPQMPSPLHLTRHSDQNDASSVGFMHPQRPATSLGSHPLKPHGHGRLHPASALNSASRYSLGGDPYLPRNQLRRRKSVTSFKDAAPGLVLEANEYRNDKGFAIDHSPKQKPSVEIIVAGEKEESKGDIHSDSDSSEAQQVFRSAKPETRYARPSRRAGSRGPRIRRMRSRSHFGRLPRNESDKTAKLGSSKNAGGKDGGEGRSGNR